MSKSWLPHKLKSLKTLGLFRFLTIHVEFFATIFSYCLNFAKFVYWLCHPPSPSTWTKDLTVSHWAGILRLVMGKNLVWLGEIERKLAKLAMTTFTYRSSFYLFYGLCLICQCNLSCQQSNNSGGDSLQTMSALYSLQGELKENQSSQNWLQSCSFSFHGMFL